MAAARYWRAVGVATYDGGDLELSAFYLHDAAFVRLDAAATLSASLSPVSGVVANLQDTDLATTVRFNAQPPGFELRWDFGVGVTADVAGVQLGSAASEARFLSHFTLQYSTDGLGWSTLTEFGRFIWPGANTLTDFNTGDNDFADVTLLLHGDSAFADTSPLAQTLTVANGTPGFSTAAKKFGAASMDFRRTGAVLCPSNMDFGTGDFTVETWVYWNSAVGANEWGLFQLSVTSAGYAANHNNLAAMVAPGPVYAFYTGGAYFATTKAVTTGVWVHLAISRSAGRIRAFVDGEQIMDRASTFNFANAYGLIGGYYSATYNADAYLDDFRVTKGVARYTEGFTPPTAAFPDTGNTAIIPIPLLGVKPASHSSAFWREDVTGVVGSRLAEHATRFRDVFLSGRGFITATVKEDGTPTDTPVRRKVRLFRDRDGLMVRETWSNATTGSYTFTEIDENETYSVVSYDHNNNFRAVIADRITPTVA